jgi:ribosomal peptide maturation radical SAM protein 1
MDNKRIGAVPRTALVVMPWASTQTASIAAGLLAALARERGGACTVLYPNLTLASILGSGVYEWLADEPSLFALEEHLFAVDLFGTASLQSGPFLRRVARTLARDAELTMSLDTLIALRDVIVPSFLDGVVARVVSTNCEIVGFTCVFNQVMASLAVARRLKRQRPDLRILLGGASVHGTMGERYAQAFSDCVDHVFTGEADASFPALLDALRRGVSVDVAGVTTDGRLGERAPLMFEMDTVSIPDYSDYFSERSAIERSGRRLPPLLELPFETARGCWWGAKHHCTFCGLNGEGMAFRAKSVERVLDEVTTLSRRYGITAFAATDNILNHTAYSALLPRLASLGLDIRLFFEIKANLSRAKVALLREAGVWRVQPGIESFSDHVLFLMRKGVSAAQNVMLLRLAEEYGLILHYNLLVGFPGERGSDYRQLLHLLPRLWHLPPPTAGSVVPVEVHRFSPFHSTPEEFGLRDVRPAPHYRHLLPASLGDRGDFAYFFSHRLPRNAPIRRYRAMIDEILSEWHERPTRMSARLGPGFVHVRQRTKSSDDKTLALEGEYALTLMLTDSPCGLDTIQRGLDDRLPDRHLDARRVVAWLMRRGLVVRCSNRYVHVVPFESPHSSADIATWIDRWSAR